VSERAARTCVGRQRRGALSRQPGVSGAYEAAGLAQAFGQSMASSQQETDIPPGYAYYETLIILRPDMSEEERCAPWSLHVLDVVL